MSPLRVPRLLAAGTIVGISTTVRASAGGARLAVARFPTMARLAVGATRSGPDAEVAASALRDEMLGLMRDSGEAYWRRLRSGVDEFDALTRGSDGESTRRRLHRVKR